MRKLLKKYGFVPDKLVTDDLRSYGAAASDLGIAKHHERGRWRNNFIAENDLVFAIWQEPLAKCGIGLLVLKGDDVLRRSMSENWTLDLKVSALQVSG